ncbi:MAG: 30S ribosomal protein S7 [Candidatus Caenarcaniphilales bacterium]|nr:30S ribosomal protein S7 [Candidatus Caenarcaniphilales bacterium]
MSRKTVKRKRRASILESKHKNPILSKFIRMLMWSGKLSISEKIVYDTLNSLEDQLKQPGLDVFLKALENVKPLVKVKARRVGGATYQVPVEVPDDLGWTLAMRWIIAAARKKSGASMEHKLTRELGDAFEKRGDAYRVREETHRMAEANRAFAHYRV